MDCNSCKEKQKQAEPIPFIAYESGMAKMGQTNNRLWVVVIILIVALIASNAGWIYYESSFIDESIIVEQENEDGYNNYIGNDGDITN